MTRTIWRARCPHGEQRSTIDPGVPEERAGCGCVAPWERWEVTERTMFRNPHHGGVTTFPPGIEPPFAAGWKRVTKRTLRRVVADTTPPPCSSCDGLWRKPDGSWCYACQSYEVGSS